MKKKILITGSSGFVGQALLAALQNANYDIQLFRRGDPISPDSFSFQGLDAVVHLAGKAHDKGATWEDFDRDNIRLTQSLLDAVRIASPRANFIFFSSAKVYGENSEQKAFSETTPPRPQSPYGDSKLLAEEIVRKSGLSFLIFRPTLIYSDSAKGNLQSLRKISKLGIPLPSNIRNHRSLATLPFVVKKTIEGLEGKLKFNEIYNLCDLNLSTSEIFRLNGVTFLMPYPPFLLKLLPHKFQQKLLLNLELDNSKVLGQQA
jgi:nucleoside-diphosphate-sugar epimerase